MDLFDKKEKARNETKSEKLSQNYFDEEVPEF